MRAAWIAAVLLLGAACGGHAPPAPAPAPVPSRIDAVRAEAAVLAMTPKVEAIRGLRFLRPVEVRTVGDDEARAYVLKRLAEFSPRERLDAEEAAFVLLGLLPAGSDLERLFLDAIEEQAGGFYDPDSGSFFLLDDMPAALAPALAAHELTHALEDQHYDLDARLRQSVENDDRFLALAAVHEGSATLVMTIVTAESLRDGSAPAQDLREFRESDAGRGERLAELPPLLKRELLGVYFLGASFLLRGRPSASAANAAFPVEDVRRAYEDGPDSSEQILHPEKYWDPGMLDPPRPVETPTPPRRLLGRVDGRRGRRPRRTRLGRPHRRADARALGRSLGAPFRLDPRGGCGLGRGPVGTLAARGWEAPGGPRHRVGHGGGRPRIRRGDRPARPGLAPIGRSRRRDRGRPGRGSGRRRSPRG